MIRLAFEQNLNEDLSKSVGRNPDQVGMWRRRWRDPFDRLVLIECREGFRALRKAIETVRADAPRSGRKPRINSEQPAPIVAIAGEPPENSGRPISTWTQREIAGEAIKRKLVESGSPRRVGEFLKPGPRSPAPREVVVECEAG